MIIDLVNERNNNNNKKDKEIKDLKLLNFSIKQDQFKQEAKIEEMRKEIKAWKVKFQQAKQDNVFLEGRVRDSKYQNRVLKLAIARLQQEFEKIKEAKGDTFVTQGAQEQEVNKDMSLESIFEILTR